MRKTELSLNRVGKASKWWIPQDGKDVPWKLKVNSLEAQKFLQTTNDSDPEDFKRFIHPWPNNWFTIRKLINAIHHINRRKQENHMFTSKDRGKKNQTKLNIRCQLKTTTPTWPRKLARDRKSLNLLKGIHRAPQLTSYSTVEEKCFPLRSRNNLTQEVLTNEIRQEREKRYCTGRGNLTLS